MKAKVLELEKKLFDGDATKIVIPAIEGEMCLLPNHISIITSLKKGIMKIYRPDSNLPLVIELNGGICSFSDNNAIFILD